MFVVLEKYLLHRLIINTIRSNAMRLHNNMNIGWKLIHWCGCLRQMRFVLSFPYLLSRLYTFNMYIY